MTRQELIEIKQETINSDLPRKTQKKILEELKEKYSDDEELEGILEEVEDGNN